MARVAQFGRMPDTAPEGNFRRFRSDEAALLDQGTREDWISRKLSSEGARVAGDLPRTMSMQYVDDTGHLRSVPAGSIHEVLFDGESGKVQFRGWLADTPDGHLAERVIASKALRHNSIDIGDIPVGGVKLTEHGNFWEDDFWLEVEFVDWGLAKSTLVASPAFKNANLEIDDILAALGDDGELVIDCPSSVSANLPFEIMASMSTRPSWDYFNRPESDIPHPIVVDEPDADGWIPVYGHLAQWRKMTRDSKGVLRHPPRGYDNYANFMKPKAVLTDNGWVAAGPITLLGGHVSLAEAAAKVENVWADVHAVDGKHGPWVCGVVRPHIAADEVETYRARASQISGYWSGGVMRLISSVPAPGYPITASADEDALVASFNDDQPVERGPFPLHALVSFDEITPAGQAEIMAWVRAGSKGGQALSIDSTAPTVTAGAADTAPDASQGDAAADGAADGAADDFAFRQRQRERELALESELV